MMIEPTILTQKNLEIARIYTEVIKDFAEGVLLSGSNSWGANHAVSGMSDIDILVIIRNMSDLASLIDCYLEIGLIEKKENSRFAVFKKLHQQNKADQYSFVAHYNDTNVSLDFMLMDVAEKIANLAPLGERDLSDNQGVIRLRTVKEFRANPPKADGYTVDDLTARRTAIYYPEYTEVVNKRGEVVGYIADTLVDGQAPTKEGNTYFLGVMAFFLVIKPTLLLDAHGDLSRLISTLKKNIAGVMDGRPISHITRKERMTDEVFEEIKRSLT